MTRWNLHKVEEAFAAAAIDPGRWPDALACISAETDSSGALVFPVAGAALPHMPVTDALARANETYFRDGWHLRDVRFGADMARFHAGVIDDFDCLPADEIGRHPYYQEFLAPAGLKWFAGVKMQAGDDVWCVSINRSIARGPFSPGEKRRLATLSRKLASAAALSQAFGAATSAATLEAFDVSGTAAVLLDGQARVVRTNHAADRLLRAQTVRLLGGRLGSNDPAATAALAHALNELLWSSAGSSLMPAVALPRPPRTPVLAYPMKLPSLSSNPLGQAQAVVILVDPAGRTGAPELSLRRAFALTAAEARLAGRMATGSTLEQCCERIGISKETGRNQLKSVFAKMGVNRQAELVLLMSRML